MTALDALADPVRRRLCEQLRLGEVTAGTLVELVGAEFGISQPAVSRHLRVLRDAGVVSVRAEATTRWYALDRATLAVAADWFTQFEAAVTPALDALGTEIARGKRSRRRSTTTAPHEETA